MLQLGAIYIPRTEPHYPGANIAVTAIFAAVVSLVVAFCIRKKKSQLGSAYKLTWAYVLVALWTIIPPIWFGFEFMHWQPPAWRLEYMKQGQEHARNIWIAFVILLAAITKIKWKAL